MAITFADSAWSQSDTLSARRMIERYYAAIDQHEYVCRTQWVGSGDEYILKRVKEAVKPEEIL